jgi:hypothetical protein
LYEFALIAAKRSEYELGNATSTVIENGVCRKLSAEYLTINSYLISLTSELRVKYMII